MLRTACRQAARWRDEFADEAPLPIHVNFSARQVAQLDLPELVGTVLEETGVAPGDIALEITESALLEGAGGPIATLRELKSMGISVVLDDFGTGYSSLSYLERFPIETLKIDRTFVSPLGSPRAGAPIVTAIVGMARALAVGTIAEGVETAEQTAAVTALGCKHAQGYFFARPAAAEQITQLVRDDTPLRERAAEARALAPNYVSSRPHLARGWSQAPPSVAEYRQSFLTALLAVDSHGADEVVYSALADQIGPDVIDAQIIAQAMVEIGRLWERGQVSIAEEHLATGIASQAAELAARADGLLSNRLPAPVVDQTVLLANVEGEGSCPGAADGGDTLGSLGTDVRYSAARSRPPSSASSQPRPSPMSSVSRSPCPSSVRCWSTRWPPCKRCARTRAFSSAARAFRPGWPRAAVRPSCATSKSS